LEFNDTKDTNVLQAMEASGDVPTLFCWLFAKSYKEKR